MSANIDFTPDWDLYSTGYSDTTLRSTTGTGVPARSSTTSTSSSSAANSDATTFIGEMSSLSPTSSQGSAGKDIEQGPYEIDSTPSLSRPRRRPTGKPPRSAPVITHTAARKRAIGTTEYIVYSSDGRNPKVTAAFEKIMYDDWKIDPSTVWTLKSKWDSKVLYWTVCLTKDQVTELAKIPSVGSWCPADKNPIYEPGNQNHMLPLDEQYDKEICATKWLPKPKAPAPSSRRFSRLPTPRNPPPRFSSPPPRTKIHAPQTPYD
ncbi:hypothetical protein G7Y89_g4037 [Cudoniella acicularis]|uniref:Uncharacterized protein n=1 Tax=Cudoniella acicularis TaxID=354080 RepID=A0A8H4W4N2_9HELO|nr:hypothetical protein G7Y89_g4037 [Cudoniella acicularis]